MRTAGLFLCLTLAVPAVAQTYSLEGGGPFDLAESLAAAAAAWNEATEEAALEEAPGAPTTFSFADSELLGPDVVSATLIREGEEDFDVWLNPETLEEFPQALLHELGLLLGLASSQDPEEPMVMDPALSGETPDVPTVVDQQAIVDALARAGGDVDGNGVVDIADLAALGRDYGRRGVNLSADLDADGVVDADDVELMRENYTFTEPAPVDVTGAETGPDAAPGTELDAAPDTVPDTGPDAAPDTGPDAVPETGPDQAGEAEGGESAVDSSDGSDGTAAEED